MALNNDNRVENGILQWQLSSQQRWIGQHHDKSPKEKYWTGRMQQPRRHRITSPPAREPIPLMARTTSRERPQRTKNGSNWATGGPGPGMQAIFLGSNRTCGTGVFLPRIKGSDVQLLTSKPACSPVLLPYRVVQTLKLDVYEVGKQMKSQTDQSKNIAKRNENAKKNKKLDVDYISPEIYLPKEWTY